ncbi:MAG TPA: PilZ domain-containing protein [bacterium]
MASSDVNHERRQTARIRTHLPVRLSDSRTQQVMQTLTKDLGTGGLRCISQSAVAIDTPFTVEVTVPGRGEIVKLRGRTAWLGTIPYSGQYELGIQFLEQTELTSRLLSAYIERFLPESYQVTA